MMRSAIFGFFYIALFLCCTPAVQGQEKERGRGYSDKPKIIVGVVVDQMRWDFLYRYRDRYSEDGFRRMLDEGFTYENAMIDYAPTVTGAGHAGIFTGSVPAIHGIAGNNWYDRELEREVYCAEDTTVQRVGATHSGRSRSPENLLVTTIGDELKLSNNFRSKVVGVSFKDRGAVFPAGHSADGAYWYDGDSGRFVTSSYYMEALPDWMTEFNDRELPGEYLEQTWEPLYPLDTYGQSTSDDQPYEEGIGGKEKSVFPYDYAEREDNDYGLVRNSPYGNTLTFDVAKAAIEGEALGSDEFPDLLAISLSTPDGLGHRVGPNAIETEDMYLRLDREFSAFFEYLDERFGRGGYLLFMTADHGVSQSPGFLKQHRLPAGTFDERLIVDLNSQVRKKYGIGQIVVSASNYQLYLNDQAIREAGIERETVTDFILQELKKNRAVSDALPMDELGTAPWPAVVKEMFINGYNAKRSGDIAVIFRPGWKVGDPAGASHGSWYPYDAHIPLVWMGWNIPGGTSHRTVMMADIAPTLAAMLKIQMPSGTVGEPLSEIVDDRDGISPY